jgi:hypothetical protein
MILKMKGSVMERNLAGEIRASRQYGLAFRLVAGAVVVAAISVAVASSARAEMSADEIRSKVTADYGVTALKVTPVEGASGGRYAVTVMAPGGDRNDAYQVNTIVLDAGTGKPVIQYGHAGGQQQSAAPAISHRTHPRLDEGN